MIIMKSKQNLTEESLKGLRVKRIGEQTLQPIQTMELLRIYENAPTVYEIVNLEIPATPKQEIIEQINSKNSKKNNLETT